MKSYYTQLNNLINFMKDRDYVTNKHIREYFKENFNIIYSDIDVRKLINIFRRTNEQYCIIASNKGYKMIEYNKENIDIINKYLDDLEERYLSIIEVYDKIKEYNSKSYK